MTNDFKLGFCPPESLRRVKPWGPALEIQAWSHAYGHIWFLASLRNQWRTCLIPAFASPLTSLFSFYTIAVLYASLCLTWTNCHSVRSVAESLVPRNHLGSPDLARVLHLLYRPVSMDLSRQWLPSDIDSFIAASSKALLLRYRSLHQTDPSSARGTPVASFRSYLFPCTEKALVRLLTSSHTLAVEGPTMV